MNKRRVGATAPLGAAAAMGISGSSWAWASSATSSIVSAGLDDPAGLGLLGVGVVTLFSGVAGATLGRRPGRATAR